MTLAVSGVGFKSAVEYLNVYLKKKPIHLREHFDTISYRLGPWQKQGEDRKLSEEFIETLGTRVYLERDYALEGRSSDVRIALHLAYYTGMIDAVPHVPDRCLVAGGFNARTQPRNLLMNVARDGWDRDPRKVNRATGEPYRFDYVEDLRGQRIPVRMPIGEFRLRTTEFSHDQMPGARTFGGYFFVANGRTATTPEDVKLLAFDKSEEYAYYCKVQFLMIGSKDLTEERFLERSVDLLQPLLPELMACLPDWAEVEAMTEAARAEDQE